MFIRELFHTHRRILRQIGLRRSWWLGCALLLMGVAWAEVNMDRMRERMQQQFGGAGVQSLLEWREMLQQARRLPDDEKLRRTNEFFNRRIRFQDDIVVWRLPDYWASPLELLGQGSGDCEDYAIAKYHSLIELGIPSRQLRMIYVRATLGGQQLAHMVLGYYPSPDAEPLVLDNLITDIRPASRRPDLTPVFSFNSEGVFMGGARQPSSPVDRLSLWAGLKSKMRGEGYEP